MCVGLMLEEFSVWVQPSFHVGKRNAQRGLVIVPGLQQEGAVSQGESLLLLPLSKLKGKPVRKPPYSRPWTRPSAAAPSLFCSNPQPAPGFLCKPFSSACPAGSALLPWEPELDKIFYDPTLMLYCSAHVGFCWRICQAQSWSFPPQTPPLATISH